MKPLQIPVNRLGWVHAEGSQQLLRAIFPNYPDVRPAYPMPAWVPVPISGSSAAAQ